MSEGIDLSKLLPIDIYSPDSQAIIYVELLKTRIELGQYLLDLIYSDISGSYIQKCSKVKYYVAFFVNYDKTSEVIFFLAKMEY